mmetsp:Transcript_53725/g.89360  ORF Transcript_53725/g.89360 Transcript_53725/m.89360 type:complete len:809 (-) Transcript_53725:413-2839(-)
MRHPDAISTNLSAVMEVEEIEEESIAGDEAEDTPRTKVLQDSVEIHGSRDETDDNYEKAKTTTHKQLPLDSLRNTPRSAGGTPRKGPTPRSTGGTPDIAAGVLSARERLSLQEGNVRDGAGREATPTGTPRAPQLAPATVQSTSQSQPPKKPVLVPPLPSTTQATTVQAVSKGESAPNASQVQNTQQPRSETEQDGGGEGDSGDEELTGEEETEDDSEDEGPAEVEESQAPLSTSMPAVAPGSLVSQNASFPIFSRATGSMQVSTSDSAANPLMPLSRNASLSGMPRSRSVRTSQPSESSKKSFGKIKKSISVRTPYIRQYLAAVGKILPSSFRPSILKPLRLEGRLLLSQRLTPVLSMDGLSLRDLEIDPATQTLKPLIFRVHTLRIVEAKGVPLPGVPIIARRVRICMFDRMSFVGNSHTVPVKEYSPSENIWRFSAELKANNMYVRANRNDPVSVFFELVAVIPAVAGGKTTQTSIGQGSQASASRNASMRTSSVSTPQASGNAAVARSASMRTTSVSSNQASVNAVQALGSVGAQGQSRIFGTRKTPKHIEISCGWHVLVINQVNPKGETVELDLQGGTPYRPVDIDPNSIPDIKGMWAKMKSNFRTKDKPCLVVSVAKETRKAVRDCSLLPTNIIVPTKVAQLIGLYRELQVQRLIKEQELSYRVSPVVDPVLALFPRLLDHPMYVQGLITLWRRQKRKLSLFERQSTILMVTCFRDIVERVWASLQVLKPFDGSFDGKESALTQRDALFPKRAWTYLPPYKRVRALMFDAAANQSYVASLSANSQSYLFTPFNINEITYSVP